MLRALSSIVSLSLLLSCGPLTPPSATPPQGLSCQRVIVPSGDLAEALGRAGAGDCVILPGGTYSGTFVLPEDVSLAASAGETVTLTDGEPVLTVRGGERSMVEGLSIVAGSGGGISIDPGPVRLVGVKVTQSQTNAISASCTRADCAEREVVLTNCELTQNAVGLRVTGARVKVEGGRIAEQAGTSLSAGSGIVASAGAVVALSAVTVEANENVGVLLDGAATRATIDGCAVKNNQGRGIWAQGQADDAGVATISVSGGEISGNALVGIGARDTSGLSVKDVLIKNTVAVRVPIDISHAEDVGDGVGLFSGTTNATLENVTLQDNARAQLLADGFGPNLRVVTSTLSGGRFRVVSQRSADALDVAPQLIDDAGVPLIVQSTAINLLP